MATRVEANYVLTASDETARAFRSVENNLKGMKDEMAGIGKTAGLAFKLFVGGELLEGLRKLGGAMFDVKNATNAIDAGRIQKMRESTAAAGKAFAGVAATIGSMLAPVIERLSNWFVKAVGDGEGLKRFFHALFVGLVRGVGIFADAWRGMEIVWAGLKTLFWGFVGSMTDGLRQWDKVFVDVANKIPGVNLKYSEAIGQMAKESKANLEKNRQEMVDLLKKPLPSDAMLAAVAQMDKETAAYKAAADTRVQIKKEEHKQINEENEFQGEIVITKLRGSDAEVAAEEQAIKERMHKDRLQELGQFAWMEQAKWNLQQKGFKARLAGVSTLLGQAANLMNSDRKKEFEIGKKAAIANALVEMGKGIGVAIGYGPILGPPMAALVLANGLANIRQIKSQQFAGGGSANVGATAVQSVDAAGLPDRSGSAQEAPTMPMSSQSGGPSRQVTLIVQSDSGMVSMDWVRNQLAPVMNEAAGDGVKFMVA
jgi:hypothetical protein